MAWGPIMANQALIDALNSRLFADSVPEYVQFDYKVGGFVVIKIIADNFREITNNINGNSIDEINIMNGINSMKILI